MALVVYILCAVTSSACTALLLKTYRRNRVKLLLWSGLCFAGFALNNLLLILDLKVFPEVDLSIIRAVPTLLGLLLLLYGLIWESR